MMKKILFLFAFVAAGVLTGCSKEDGDDASKNLSIKLKTEESYRFNENGLSVITAPKDFVATVSGNEVKGLHQGETDLVVKAGNITYNCKIKVEAAHTLYIDMAIYLGQSKTNIIKLYGEPIKTVDNTSLFGPLTSLTSEINNIFIFDENDKVVSCAIYFPISSGMSIVSHLKGRYVTYTSKDYKALMGDANDIEKCNVVALYDFSETPVSVMYSTKAYLDKESSGKSNSSVAGLSLLENRAKALFLQK